MNKLDENKHPKTWAYVKTRASLGHVVEGDSVGFMINLEEELIETEKDYLAVARPLDGHTCAECVLNLRRILRVNKDFEVVLKNIHQTVGESLALAKFP